MNVLGISLGHDTNFALVEDGRLVAVVEAERFFRQKRYKLHCLTLEAGKRPSGFQYVDVAETELFLKALGDDWGFEFDHVAVQNQGREDEFKNLKVLLERLGFRYKTIHNANHHLSHAALSYYTSPFPEALIFSYDGFGNDGSTLLFRGTPDGGVEYLHEDNTRFGQSYSNAGHIAGIRPEVCGTTSGKAMGLAAYGAVREDWLPAARRYVREYRKLPQTASDEIRPFGAGHRINSVGLDDIPDLAANVGLVDDDGNGSMMDRIKGLLGAGKRRRVLRLGGDKDEAAQDLIATVQAAWTDRAIDILSEFRDVSRNLCLVGGCALNGVTNDAIQRSGLFDAVHFVPNPSDCGLAGGAALLVAWRESGREFEGAAEYFSPYLGRQPFDLDRMAEFREAYPHRELSPERTPEILARLLADDRLVGVIRGRYEIGPRALGNRSILCNPLNPDMRGILNDKVKHREWYRPFAPVATAEDAGRYFTNVTDIPYMSVICETRPQYAERLPSVTHVDGTARLQTVRREQNPFLYDTLKAFEEHSGVPVLLNTSFNPHGEPILNYCSAGLEMLETTDLDLVLIDDTLFAKPGRESLIDEVVSAEDKRASANRN